MNIRIAAPADAPQLLHIYAPYVEKTSVTFEYEVPSVEDFTERVRRTLGKYPYLAAEEDSTVLGYAYASAFKARAAYNWSVETSIYIREDMGHNGIGTALYKALEKVLTLQNVCNLCACIAYPNPASVSFHERFGYKTVAHFHASGFKQNAWSDMIWMEKELCPHTIPPHPFIPFPDLPPFTL